MGISYATLLEKYIAYGILMMKHHERARLLQDEYYRIVGIRPSYPRSRVELQRLSKQIDDLKQGLREIREQRAEREVINNDDDEDEDPTLSLFLNYLERKKMQN